MDAISAAAAKVGASFAALAATSQLKKLENTPLGDQLSKIGLVKPGFTKRLEQQLAKAADRFLRSNNAYNIEPVHYFLEDPTFLKLVKSAFFHGETPDTGKAAEILASYVGVSVTSAPHKWPGGIEPLKLIEVFFVTLSRVLGEETDAAGVFLAQRIAVVSAQIEGLRPAISAALKDHDVSTKNAVFEGFERNYLGHLTKKFGRISTLGARELHGIGQVLSVAYISLNILSQESDEPVPAEHFLKEHDQLIVRGPAGSGKTTLLSWLVTQCSRSDTKFAGFVPFFVPLRTVARVEVGPPSVEAFVDYSVDASLWAESTPAGWLNDVLKTRQSGLIMIDGVDELPASRRPQFWEWLESFSEHYPGNKIIVTSRNLPKTNSTDFDVKTEQWNPPSVFVEARLQEMSDPDVTNFINHWHDAVDFSKLTPDEQASLVKAKNELPAKLEDPASRRIRELCSTPLLCAMVCVLHWREEGYLPKHRVDLYDKCCEMLIEARDLKREIALPIGPLAFLTKYDKEMVLQRLAFDMLHNRPDGDDLHDNSNYRIEVSRDKAELWIAPRVASFQNIEARSASPEAVLDFLIERTGLLREPSKDLIDFPHRTFQEYLAACAAGAEGREEMLSRLADDDQWHETIMLASGTSTGGVGFGKRLIEALISRGERHVSKKPRSQRIRKTCFALALGCLENLRQHDPDLRDRVLSNLDELVPPHTETDAAILAVAGDAAVPHLTYTRWKDSSTIIVSACARALRLIGTTNAAKSLSEGYIADVRSDVISEVARTAQFPFHLIQGIQDHVAQTGRLPAYIRDVSDILLLVGLQNLQSVLIDSNTKGLPLLSQFHDLKSLSLRQVDTQGDWVSDIPASIIDVTMSNIRGPVEWLERLVSLESLVLIDSELSSISSLPTLPNLNVIRMLNCPMASLEGLGRFPLRQLDIRGATVASLDGLSELNSLSGLTIDSCPNITLVSPAPYQETLESLSIESCLTAVDPSVQLPRLKKLTLEDVPDLYDLNFLRNAPEVSDLVIIGDMIFEDFSGVDHLKKLETLYFSGFSSTHFPEFKEMPLLRELSIIGVQGFEPSSISSVHWLEQLSISLYGTFALDWAGNLSNLRSLSILDAVGLASLEGLSTKSLDVLVIQGAPNLSDLSVLRGSNITELRLLSCPSITTLSDLAELEKLETLHLSVHEGSLDLSPLGELPNLQIVNIVGREKNIRVPEALMPKVRHNEFYFDWQFSRHPMRFGHMPRRSRTVRNYRQLKSMK
ncbi:NACHT domain-containing protein [Devosia psychrophila]|uniref:NACHT domain-containing protein n=1 Tax=Devosia psychrophila TaxID=728005 RepID=A0A0F5Q440_9HYPH|nr:NACHT domain-containing protein [Devosia psychrophila]KKC34839.1 hypothetical protein WH91_01015 [Devosia psychrophila]SFC10110.1 NACHT domain-containing protein [Devosia psychrophila]